MGFGKLCSPNPIFSIFSRLLGRLYREQGFDFNTLMASAGVFFFVTGLLLPCYGLCDWLHIYLSLGNRAGTAGLILKTITLLPEEACIQKLN